MLQQLARRSDADSRQQVTVRHLRQVLLWPLRLIPDGVADQDSRRRAPWPALRAMGDASPWREHVDEDHGGAGAFHERHYNEFVSFLPYVQRFLYGEGRAERGSGDATTGSPMRVFRRSDIGAVRVVFGLIGTIATGFLGMHVIAAADAPLATRTLAFLVVLALTVALTAYPIGKSKRLSDFLDAMSDERLPVGAKVRAFFAVWRAPR